MTPKENGVILNKRMNNLVSVDSSKFTKWTLEPNNGDIQWMFNNPERVHDMIQKCYKNEFEKGKLCGNEWKKQPSGFKWRNHMIRKSNKKSAPKEQIRTTKPNNKQPPNTKTLPVLSSWEYSFASLGPSTKGGDDDDRPDCCYCYDAAVNNKLLATAVAEDRTSMLICSDCARLMLQNVVWPPVSQEDVQCDKVKVINIVRQHVNAKAEYMRYQTIFTWDDPYDDFYREILTPIIKDLQKKNTQPSAQPPRPFRYALLGTAVDQQPQAHVVVNNRTIAFKDFSREYIRVAMLDMRNEEDGSFMGAYGYLMLYSWIRADINASAMATIQTALASFAFTIGFVTGTGLIDKLLGTKSSSLSLHVLKSLIRLPATVLHLIPSILYWQDRFKPLTAEPSKNHLIVDMYVNAFGRYQFQTTDSKFIPVAAVQLDRALENLSKQKAWLRDGLPAGASAPDYLQVPCVFELVPGMRLIAQDMLSTDTQKTNFKLFGYDPVVMSLILDMTPLMGGGGKLAGIWLGMGVTFLCAVVPAFW